MIAALLLGIGMAGNVLPNPLISVAKPVFASGTAVATPLVDGGWGYPTWAFAAGSWAAIKVGAGPQKVLVAWSDAVGNWSDSVPANQTCMGNLSLARKLSIAVSGNSTNGVDGDWVVKSSLANNTVAARGHLIDFAGASWVKLQVAEGSGVLDEIEVFDATHGGDDSWFLLGTSITAISGRNYPKDSSIAQMVHTRNGHYTPAVVRGGVSCINSTQVAASISAYLAGAANLRHWAIEMGTNDGWANGTTNLKKFTNNLQTIIDSARAHGIEPMIARPLATDPKRTANSSWQLDSGYARAVDSLQKRNHLLVGPDFYGHFLAHPEELSSDGVHPAEAGVISIRRLWAQAMVASGRYADSLPPTSVHPAKCRGLGGSGARVATDALGRRAIPLEARLGRSRVLDTTP